MDKKGFNYKYIVVTSSLLLMLVVIPHVLEDFALGEPAKNKIPELLLQLVVAGLISFQALGLYKLGSGKRFAYYIHLVIGLIWPLLAGFAQLPSILSGMPYRSGFISIFFVLAIIIVGALLFISSLLALKHEV